MLMTRKDYVLIADAIKKSINQIPPSLANENTTTICQIIVSRLIVALAIDDAAFDAEKFSKACGF